MTLLSSSLIFQNIFKIVRKSLSTTLKFFFCCSRSILTGRWIFLWTVLSSNWLISIGIHYEPDIPPGPYCASKYRELSCCDGRQDNCAAPILGTLCYCDDFCNRTRDEDCCPDFWSFCKGDYTHSPGNLVLDGMYKKKQ